MVDGRGPRLMPAMPISQKHCFFKKGPKNQQILKNSNFFFISGSIFIGLFWNVIGWRGTEGNAFAVKSQIMTTTVLVPENITSSTHVCARWCTFITHRLNLTKLRSNQRLPVS